MAVLGFIGAVLALLLLIAAVDGAVCYLRSPPHVRKAHERLSHIVRASNLRELTDEEVVILKDAQSVGMVKTSLSSWKGGFLLKYHISDFAREMALEGRYPTSDQIDEELKQFEVAQPSV